MVVMTGFCALARWKAIGAGFGGFKPLHRGRGPTGDAARLLHPTPTPGFGLCCPLWRCAGFAALLRRHSGAREHFYTQETAYLLVADLILIIWTASLWRELPGDERQRRASSHLAKKR